MKKMNDKLAHRFHTITRTQLFHLIYQRNKLKNIMQHSFNTVQSINYFTFRLNTILKLTSIDPHTRTPFPHTCLYKLMVLVTFTR